MVTRPFHSILFEKYIQPNDPEWRAKAKAELLYRIFDLDEKKCDCMGCKEERERYLNILNNPLFETRISCAKKLV